MRKILGFYQVIHDKSSQGTYFIAEDGIEAFSTDPGFTDYWVLTKMCIPVQLQPRIFNALSHFLQPSVCDKSAALDLDSVTKTWAL